MKYYFKDDIWFDSCENILKIVIWHILKSIYKNIFKYIIIIFLLYFYEIKLKRRIRTTTSRWIQLSRIPKNTRIQNSASYMDEINDPNELSHRKATIEIVN